MYCSNCGRQAAGNFCSGCGAKLGASVLPVARAIVLPDWRDEVRHAELLRHPEVRDRIARSVAKAVKGMSGEKWLELFDKLAKPPVSFKTVVEIAQPLYARLGIGTGKARSELLDSPPGAVIVGVLCSLARHGREVTDVHQGEDGCVIDATLPSDLLAMAGTLVVTVRKARSGTRVEAATTIPSQLFDWGKSRRCLDQFFAELSETEGSRAA